jgi:hypothetical protein
MRGFGIQSSPSRSIRSRFAALVKCNLSIDDELGFPNKRFAMDAALRDSVINGFPVSGQMAIRVTWGDQPKARSGHDCCHGLSLRSRRTQYTSTARRGWDTSAAGCGAFGGEDEGKLPRRALG